MNRDSAGRSRIPISHFIIKYKYLINYFLAIEAIVTRGEE